MSFDRLQKWYEVWLLVIALPLFRLLTRVDPTTGTISQMTDELSA